MPRPWPAYSYGRARRHREVLFRVLIGPQGSKLREIACPESRVAQLRPAIDWLVKHYSQSIHAEPLAALAGMSVAAFYRHFKSVTSMAPIQYQKKLRLLQARRLLRFEGRDVASVAYAVGYASASHFGRDYVRMFGVSPGRDAGKVTR